MAGALNGLRILDMTQYEAGTSCTQALAWLGADVVKIESPQRGDPGRGPNGNAEYFMVWNSNKRSLALDLKSSKGRNLLLELLPKFDVFVENYGPGVIERLDLGYEALRAVKPDIIYARLKGFGLSGPWADYKCYDMVAQSAAGAFSITGEPDGPPMRPGPTMGDAGTGVQMALAISAAYVQKMKTGNGQFIELSMQEAMTYYLRTSTSGGGYGQRAAGRSGNGYGPTSTLYRCKGDGANDYVYVMAVTQRMTQALLKVVGKEDLVEQLADEEPSERRRRMREEIEQWTASRDKYEAMQELGGRRRTRKRCSDHEGFVHQSAPCRARIRQRSEPPRARHSPLIGVATAYVRKPCRKSTPRRVSENIHAKFCQQNLILMTPR